MLVLLSYMRSGFTFTAEIIQRSPEVFYVFEPLYSVEEFIHNQKPFIYFNTSLSYNNRQLSTLENFLTCNLRDIDIGTLRQGHMRRSKDTSAYYVCLRKNTGTDGIRKCLHAHSLEKSCERSRVSAVKTIRYSMKSMRELMQTNKEVNVVHLLRDPRATLQSKASVGNVHWQNLDSSGADTLCSRAKADLDDSVELTKEFPGRVFALRYEDLAERPLAVAENIYSLLGLDFTDSIRNFVRDITASNNTNCGASCIHKNPNVTLSRWRQILSYKQVSRVDKICENIYSHMGYLAMKNVEDLRNMSIPFYTSVPENNGLYMIN